MATSISLTGTIVPGMMKRESKRQILLVDATGKQFEVYPDERGWRLSQLRWLDVTVEGDLVHGPNDEKYIKVKSFHAVELINGENSDMDVALQETVHIPELQIDDFSNAS